ncbi:Complex I intermediate-associated protein 30 (CIA30) [Saccharicrinis carchari]|uniref:Complex I intermediate-associated protein 30 (CIA30) n=2 Tax=Saccharicrinis carchari TaxID=1168039 RepID=A0A521AYJ9_SACCC|nr:Complex I intermediate-associated protein 30 (CIA30) [Saccharicrinis carchari]
MGLMIPKGETTLFDFNSPETSGQWNIVNDGVMGGISQSNITLNADGIATFSGEVSLENKGGFASVRTALSSIPPKEFKGVMVRLKGDGNIYNIRFRTNRSFDGYAYQAKIKTEKEEWKAFKIPFTDFVPVYRGRTLQNKPPLISGDMAQMGFLIADKQAGSFELCLDWIKFYD